VRSSCFELWALVDAGFTSKDWFQLAYPATWFLVGLPAGYFSSGGSPQPTSSVSLVEVVRVRVSTRTDDEAQRTDEVEPWHYLLGAVTAQLMLAWGYVAAREVALGVAAALLFVTLGLMAGIVFRKMELGLFTGDWKVAVGLALMLAIGAVACGFVLLHPPAGPPAYSTLFEAYRREGLSAFSAFDSITWFFAYQGLAAIALICATVALLALSVGLVAKGAVSRWR
jgi:hypothetical protein